MGQNQWCHVGVGAPPILVYFSGDWDVHWGYGILTHGHLLDLMCFAKSGLEIDKALKLARARKGVKRPGKCLPLAVQAERVQKPHMCGLGALQ